MSEESSKKKSARTPTDKLRILAEAARLSDEELGAFLCKEGVHDATRVQWRETASLPLGAVAKPHKSVGSFMDPTDSSVRRR